MSVASPWPASAGSRRGPGAARRERRARPFRHLGAARGEHAAEEGVHVLVLAEAEDAEASPNEPTGRPAEAGAEGLRRVLDQRHAALGADARDHVHVAGEAVQVRDHHGAGVGVDRASRSPPGRCCRSRARCPRTPARRRPRPPCSRRRRSCTARARPSGRAGSAPSPPGGWRRARAAWPPRAVRPATRATSRARAGSAALPAAGRELAGDRGVGARVVVEAVAGKRCHPGVLQTGLGRTRAVYPSAARVGIGSDAESRESCRRPAGAGGPRARDTMRAPWPAPTCSPS